MMERFSIEPKDFACKATSLWMDQWLLLAAGKYPEAYNAMTVGWGAIGTMWIKPFVMVVVRPQRYTMEFLKKYPTFTVSAFPEEYRNALKLCGTKSGRDCDKLKLAGFTPEAANVVEAPAFAEAELVIECKKIYQDVFSKEGFIPPEMCDKLYPDKDNHIILFGEIAAITATGKYKEEK